MMVEITYGREDTFEFGTKEFGDHLNDSFSNLCQGLHGFLTYPLVPGPMKMLNEALTAAVEPDTIFKIEAPPVRAAVISTVLYIRAIMEGRGWDWKTMIMRRVS